jgi:hypothetical protein
MKSFATTMLICPLLLLAGYGAMALVQDSFKTEAPVPHERHCTPLGGTGSLSMWNYLACLGRWARITAEATIKMMARTRPAIPPAYTYG